MFFLFKVSQFTIFKNEHENEKNLNEKIFVENDAIENVTADDNNVNEKVNIENVIVKNLIEIIIVDND